MPSSKFSAQDAFTYTDAYRRYLNLSAAALETERRRLEEKVFELRVVPSRLWAEFRAVQHALDFVVSGKEPEAVILGESEGEGPGQAEPNLEELKEKLRECSTRLEGTREALKKSEQSAGQLESELVVRNSQIAALNKRIAYSQSAMTVLGAALAFVVAGILLYLAL